jgi:homogentisate 1,2-dioxygenase
MSSTAKLKPREGSRPDDDATGQAPSRTNSAKHVTGEAAVREQALRTAAGLQYLTGFGNEHASEAVPGALPIGRNYPQHAPYGLYVELFSETAFPELRGNTRRSWLYRKRPSVASPRYEQIDNGTLLTPPFTDVPIEPNMLYWEPRTAPAAGTDFVAGLWTLGGNGDPTQRNGVAIHLYTADTSMTNRIFSTSDGELLIVPSMGAVLIHTELGLLSVEPGEVALIPRSHKFRVEIQSVGKEGFVRGYVFENFGRPFVLPELGFTGQSGMANPRDFRAPTAAYEQNYNSAVEVIHKLGGNLWRAVYDHSPLDVVAWHGNSVPYVYNLRHFQLMGAVNFDHADPSRFTVLHSPTSIPGAGNFDFCVAPPEFQATENTLRIQYFHRNIAPEFTGVIQGSADYGNALREGVVGLTNSFVAHGPSSEGYKAVYSATEHDLAKVKRTELLFIIGEAQWPIRVTAQAHQATGTTDDEMVSGNNTLQSNFRPPSSGGTDQENGE